MCKLRNLKQAYKDAKTNNSQTRRAAKTSPFFYVFEEVLGLKTCCENAWGALHSFIVLKGRALLTA